MRIPHFPKYVITGYPKKGWKLIPELKRGFEESPDVMWTLILTGLGSFIITPLALLKLQRNREFKFQFKTDYTVLRDTELDVKQLPSYNPDELEAARKRTGMYQ